MTPLRGPASRGASRTGDPRCARRGAHIARPMIPLGMHQLDVTAGCCGEMLEVLTVDGHDFVSI